MGKINILDCTLRDGGYINNWRFGNGHIKQMLNYITEAEIEFIECGYLSNKISYDIDRSIFDSIDRLRNVLPFTNHSSKFVCMINFGEFNVEDIPDYDGTSVHGIRVVFHKKQMDAALNFCEELKKKGYMLFVQPMVTINYSDEELLYLIKRANVISPYAFYIVDSFGVLKEKDLLRMYYLLEHNLDMSIRIGYHAHNNLQLAYSNAQTFANIHTGRERIIDSSVFGMGRGAGNLNTELFVQFLNETYNANYNVYPLLRIIDETVGKIYAENYWGYSLPHYLSATYNCHPSYASYLADKNTLSVKSIQEILSKIELTNKDLFDKEHIEHLYNKLQRRVIDDSYPKRELKKELLHNEILIIAPGKSLESHKDIIDDFIKSKNPICISINFVPEDILCRFIFVSNAKRLNQMKQQVSKKKLILTSNLDFNAENVLKVNYDDLLNLQDSVSDNAALMLLYLLKSIGTKKVYVAGLDGYEKDFFENYVDKELVLQMTSKKIEELNNGMEKVLKEIAQKVEVVSITPSKYV